MWKIRIPVWVLRRSPSQYKEVLQASCRRGGKSLVSLGKGAPSAYQSPALPLLTSWVLLLCDSRPQRTIYLFTIKRSHSSLIWPVVLGKVPSESLASDSSYNSHSILNQLFSEVHHPLSWPDMYPPLLNVNEPVPHVLALSPGLVLMSLASRLLSTRWNRYISSILGRRSMLPPLCWQLKSRWPLILVTWWSIERLVLIAPAQLGPIWHSSSF